MSQSTALKNTVPALIPLTPEEVRHLARPMAGFADLIEPMLEFYAANEEALRIEGLDVTKIRASLEAFQALSKPIRDAAAKLTELEESALYYSSNAWSGYLEIYARGQVVARVNRDVARGMAQFTQAMKRPRKKKGGTPSSGGST